MKKMLFVTPELPYPAHSGGKLKSLKLVERFAQEYKLSLACPLKGEDGEHVAAFLSEFHHLDKVMMHALDVPRSAVNLLRSYAAGIPLNVLRTRCEPLAQEITAVIDEYDVVFIDHYEVDQYVPTSFRGQRIYHAHNAYHKMWERFAEEGGNPLHRMAAAMETRRVAVAEVAVCNQADLVFAAPNDIEALARKGADSHRMRETWHLGDDSQLSLPPLDFTQAEERLVYVGLLGWEPNVAGLLWFLKEVWPKLVRLRPTLQFDIVGKNPDPRLLAAVAKDDRIVLHGFVENLDDVFTRARVCVAPLRFGAGMKVKVLNAMARGIPTVTTPVGAEGIDVENGQHLLLSDDADQMASDIMQLLADPVLWQRLSVQSRELIRSRYTWDKLFQMMLTAMDPAAHIRSVRARLLNGVREIRNKVYGVA